MIVVVCLNPALDITHYVPEVDWAGVNRAAAVYARPGGKGANVARTLHSFGMQTVLLGLVGGSTGAAVTAGLRELAVPAELTEVTGETRRTFTVVDDQGTTALFNEPGPEISAAEYARFRAAYTSALHSTATPASAVVLSGSLPRGLAVGSYAGLVKLAADAGVPAVLDTSGEALRRGIAAGPAIVKPNLAELRELSGRALADADGGADLAAVTTAAASLREAGAGAVVVSLGAAGLLAITEDGCWRAQPPAAATGNATGAGDAVTAALAHGLAVGRPWDERLRHAAALGAAAVAAPVAGEFSRDAYDAGLSAVTVNREDVSACR
jgi:tagatose 6-phosphate kinase